MVDNPPNEQLRVRVHSQDLLTFKRKCEMDLGKPYQLFIREMIQAFNDSRLQIVPTPEQQKTFGEIYVNRK